MKRLLICIILLVYWLPGTAQVSYCIWNIQNFGKSKSDSEIVFIANTIREFDVVAIVEVVAGSGGAQAVTRLADALNRTGNKWDYSVSDPTTGSATSERYAFLWKPSRLQKVGQFFTDSIYCYDIAREPYLAAFRFGKYAFTLVAFHALPKSKQPETEIKYLKFFPERYPGRVLIFGGDFNCPQSHTVFNPLKSQGYLPALENCKTTLRMKASPAGCLASEFDNVFYPSGKIKLLKSGTIPFFEKYADLKQARQISDHLPVFFEFDFR